MGSICVLPSLGVRLSRCCAYQGSFLKSSKSVVNFLSIPAKVPVFQGFSEIIKVVRIISEVDVTAGYDIVSFNSPQSQEPDRFIEVKAVSNSGFHWSKNEYEIAKLHGEKYFLYLIDLSKTADAEYNPVIITNPALTVMDSPDWLIEPESYYIRKI